MSSNINCQTFKDKLPWAKNAHDKERRIQLFEQMDVNGNGHLSLAELDMGIGYVLKLSELMNAKPVIIRAFNAAKNRGGTQEGPYADYIQFSEFRTLLWYLRQYFEYVETRLKALSENSLKPVLVQIITFYFPAKCHVIRYWTIFEVIDSSHDHRVGFEEFKRAIPYLNSCKVVIANPLETFQQIDRDGYGFILFEEFCAWAIQASIEMEDAHLAGEPSDAVELELRSRPHPQSQPRYHDARDHPPSHTPHTHPSSPPSPYHNHHYHHSPPDHNNPNHPNQQAFSHHSSSNIPNNPDHPNHPSISLHPAHRKPVNSNSISHIQAWHPNPSSSSSSPSFPANSKSQSKLPTKRSPVKNNFSGGKKKSNLKLSRSNSNSPILIRNSTPNNPGPTERVVNRVDEVNLLHLSHRTRREPSQQCMPHAEQVGQAPKGYSTPDRRSVPVYASYDTPHGTSNSLTSSPASNPSDLNNPSSPASSSSSSFKGHYNNHNNSPNNPPTHFRTTPPRKLVDNVYNPNNPNNPRKRGLETPPRKLTVTTYSPNSPNNPTNSRKRGVGPKSAASTARRIQSVNDPMNPSIHNSPSNLNSPSVSRDGVHKLYRDQITQLDTQVKELNEALQSSQARFHTQMRLTSDSEARAQAAQVQIDRVSDELKIERDKVVLGETREKVLTKALKETERKLETEGKNSQELTSMCAQELQRIEDLDSKLKRSQTQVKALKKQLTTLKKRVNQGMADTRSAQSEVKVQQKLAEELELENQELTDMAAESSRRADGLQTKLDSLRDVVEVNQENTRLNQQLILLTRELEMLRHIRDIRHLKGPTDKFKASSTTGIIGKSRSRAGQSGQGVRTRYVSPAKASRAVHITTRTGRNKR